MEVAHPGPQILSEPLRRGTPLPLSQLVEESRSRANIPNHLLESKIYAKLKSNGLIQAEPPVLHFSGFVLEKDYIKILKLINISSEVMNIHIIPTQTRHFQTTYTKRYRLIPGLAYTLKVRFCPDEWRYFYDCIRVHCKGEENLLIPVHAYPVIDDLHIPPHIDLSAVPLGQSVRRAIPLRCSCPIDFEFQVYVIQPHEAFSIHPLTGVIPANGEEKIIVTFSPLRYETCQVTIQLIVSQFNTKPYLCTITGSSAPHLALRDLGHGDAGPKEYIGPPFTPQLARRGETKHKTTKENDKSKVSAKPGLKPPVDVCTPAGVAKMLINNTHRLSSKDLREAISSSSMVGQKDRRMKEALFLKKVQENVKEEQANNIKWQVHVGKDPVSDHIRRQIAGEREIAQHEYMVKRGDVRNEEDFVAGLPKLSSRRVICEAGQASEGTPLFQFYPSFHWELRQRALTLFQQAARKVVIRCRMVHRLACLQKLCASLKKVPSAKKAEEDMTCDLKISPDAVFPRAFPIFSDEDDLLAPSDLAPLPVDPIDVAVTTRIPFFKPQVPQHYKLMGYRPVSILDAINSYIPTSLARPLRTDPLDELVPNEVGAQSDTAEGLEAWEEPQRESGVEDVEDVEAKEAATLIFRSPEALLGPIHANPLRIFNPAPGLQTYKPTPKYLESDLEFHLCPLPRYPVPENKMCGVRTQTTHSQKQFLNHKELVPDLMTWKNFDLMTSDFLSKLPAFTGDSAPRRSVDYSTDILPFTGSPDDSTPLMDKPCEGAGVQLTPEMIRAEFSSGEALVSNSNVSRGTKGCRRERGIETTSRSEPNHIGKSVMAKLKQLEAMEGTSHSPGAGCEEDLKGMMEEWRSGESPVH